MTPSVPAAAPATLTTTLAAALPPQFKLHGTISGLFVYPIKSCAGVRVHQAILTATGLEFDRAWMVVDADSEFVTQRQLPRMSLIEPTLKTFEMVLRAPGMLALHIALNAVEQPCRATVWGDDCAAYDMGDVAAQWFTDFLGQDLPAGTAPKKLRLVRFDPEHQRASNPKWTGNVPALNQFSDGYPVLVVSDTAVDELNLRLAAQGHSAVTVQRFRPNIVLSGFAAHDEDRVDVLHIATDDVPSIGSQSAVMSTDAGTDASSDGAAGDGAGASYGVQLALVKPCPRCPIPNINPLTAVPSPEVGDTLQAYRQDARVDGAVTFGMNAITLQGFEHTLRVGQAVGANYNF